MRKALLVLLLAGCSTVEWQKPGATPEVAEADARACSAAAQVASPLPRPQTTTMASGAVVVTEPNEPRDATRQMHEGQRMQECMRQKGYTLKSA